MLGDQYRKDSSMVANEALLYAQSLTLGGDGKDVWVFDIDETTLSNLPYYAQHGFGKPEDQRDVTANNLRQAGYHTWEKLILKGASYSGKTATLYKSSERKKLENSGYRIIGNMGDQWSDLLGTNVGNRTFKLPDPMYYIS
ncbi:Mitochondrial-processing peptidase subunit alpha isoform 1 [Hibiscus syriacus]|uniref:Mitochondrial-processing peptidase subunit alpha isoform 1 n=1 Tax=Hibiscus syriacus TaxID=106335 RepID=A0A6A3B1C4_HIBSY|nr:Mitochondrial-processing peptidase subunit alpha isoform 1 [Hibiscus syriacus]